MSKERKVFELPKDYVWKILAKLGSLADQKSFTEYGRTCVNKFIKIVRARDFDSYIEFCKCDVSLQKLNTEFPSPCIVGDRTITEIRVLRLLTLFQKYSFIESRFDRELTAFTDFQKAEKQCKALNESNKFLFEEDSSSAYYDLFVFPLVQKMKKIIRIICGKVTIPQIIHQRRNGPGASQGHRGSDATESAKCTYPLDVNSSALTLVSPHFRPDAFSLLESFENRTGRAIGSFPRFSDCFYVNNTGSDLQFVPKSAETDRTISVEPTLNVALQLGVDAILRKRLKRRLGIDLDTQERNQKLANIGSKQGNLVTIDLKAASDSISLCLLNLLPIEWAEMIFRLRSHRWNHKHYGNSEFHKISSMGNGATFILESIIFASACWAVYDQLNIPWNEETVAIYGDDLVVHESAYAQTRILLSHLGFKINTSKTFSKGPIRESCGQDFYHGHRIDRFTTKSDLQEPLSNVVLHNSLFSFFKEYKIHCDTCDELLDFILKYIPKAVKNFGPYDKDEMSSWLFSEEPVQKPFYHHGYQAWYYRIKRNVKYHPAEIFRVIKQVPTLNCNSNGELPSMTWKAFETCLPLREREWELCSYFQSNASKDIGSSVLCSALDIESSSDVYSTYFAMKKVDIVRQSATLLPKFCWSVGTP